MSERVFISFDALEREYKALRAENEALKKRLQDVLKSQHDTLQDAIKSTKAEMGSKHLKERATLEKRLAYVSAAFDTMNKYYDVTQRLELVPGWLELKSALES